MNPSGPLSDRDLGLLESSLLPSLERHHLRLLAHCLRCLQEIAGRGHGPMPVSVAIEAWMAHEPRFQSDPGFAPVFLEQLLSGAAQLERLAAELGCDPLTLELTQLVAWAEGQAQERLNGAPLTRDPA
ncbi:hypothetical protein [Cyanobium sp. Morenito 9A2]|uniref:hypothetical protein n=1 Tax=Cyanobium sp. Morenito 9A2 TaxID=2823718 RepID=UPI0020CCF4F6|nr:hypothetical protein [Cyanobium sp. Morenito 9A2]MCP9849835.1 hypothetical protein [Cyanobium sp. Morenito 9A2]